MTFQLLSHAPNAATVRVRLLHSLSISESSDSVNVDLSTLFSASAWGATVKVASVKETSLTGNQDKGSVVVGVVTLKPMQIRTFTFELQY